MVLGLSAAGGRDSRDTVTVDLLGERVTAACRQAPPYLGTGDIAKSEDSYNREKPSTHLHRGLRDIVCGWITSLRHGQVECQYVSLSSHFLDMQAIGKR